MKSNSHELETQQDSAKVTGASDRFFQNFCLGTILNQSGIRKTKGKSALTIMSSIFALAFIGKDFFGALFRTNLCHSAKMLPMSCSNGQAIIGEEP